MQDPQPQSFDDAALKSALRRALEQEHAPADLRARIRALAVASDTTAEASTGQSAEPSPLLRIAPTPDSAAADQPLKLHRRGPAFKFAAAAVLVLGFGSLGYQIWQANRPPDYAQVAQYVVPVSLYKGMTQAHDERVAGSATPPDTAKDLQSASALAQAIQRPVFVADLTNNGWKFEGGGVRDVAKHPAAQLFFTRGNAAISVFSLPASAVPTARDGVTYDTVFNGHPIAGFVRTGGLFCIVGSSTDNSLKVDEVKTLLESHRGEIAKG
jgi:hypothetical protein